MSLLSGVRESISQNYQAAETRVFSMSYGIGKSAQMLKAAVATIPAATRQIAAAGSRVALAGAIEGANIGLAVAAPMASGIKNICKSVVGIGAQAVATVTDVPRQTLHTMSICANSITAILGLSSLLEAIADTGLLVTTVESACKCKQLPHRNGTRIEATIAQTAAGVVAGACTRLVAPGISQAVVASVTASFTAEAVVLGMETTGQVPSAGVILRRGQVIKTGLMAGAAVLGFAAAGPVGAMAAGAGAGALFNTTGEMVSRPNVYLQPIADNFNLNRREIYRVHAPIVTAQTLEKGGILNTRGTPLADLVGEYVAY